MWPLRISAVVFLLFFSCNCGASVSAQGLTHSDVATVTVFVKAPDGTPLTSVTQVGIYSDLGDNFNYLPHVRGDSFEFENIPLGFYVVKASSVGYQSATQRIKLVLPGQNEAVMFFLQPEGASKMNPSGAHLSGLNPKVQKETQKALQEAQAKRMDAARKHLNAALRLAPDSAYVVYLLGMTYIWSDNVTDGKPLLEKAISLDPNHYPSLLALGILRLRQDDAAGGIQALEQAVKLSPSSWQAHWMLADGYLRQKNYSQAREHAQRAVDLGGEKAAKAQLLLGQLLIFLGERKEAAAVIAAYLQKNPKDPDVEKLQRMVATLTRTENDSPAAAKQPVTIVSTSPADAPLAAAAALALEPKLWAPPDVDDALPAIIPGQTCSLSPILQKVGQRAKELVASIEEFTATEHYQTVEIKRDGQLKDPVSAEFDYLVFFHRAGHGVLQLIEDRQLDNHSAQLPDQLQDEGAPALFLVFDPEYQPDFELNCEGLGQWNGESAWLVHFRQRPDRPNRLRQFQSSAGTFPIDLKGRAWISAQSYQILHMETDLIKPLAPLQLRREHMFVNYQLVPFLTHNVELWLPQSVDIFFDYKGRYFHHYHRFTDFKLFWVASEQKIGKPAQKDPPQ